MISDDAKGRRNKKESSAVEILQRQQPFDLEAEMGVIGSVLLLPLRSWAALLGPLS